MKSYFVLLLIKMLPAPKTEVSPYTQTGFDDNLFEKSQNDCAYQNSCGQCIKGYHDMNVHDFSLYNDNLHSMFYKTCNNSMGNVDTITVDTNNVVACVVENDATQGLSPAQLQSIKDGDSSITFENTRIGSKAFNQIVTEQIKYCTSNDIPPERCANDLDTKLPSSFKIQTGK